MTGSEGFLEQISFTPGQKQAPCLDVRVEHEQSKGKEAGLRATYPAPSSGDTGLDLPGEGGTRVQAVEQ